jgi:hypothetical protein
LVLLTWFNHRHAPFSIKQLHRVRKTTTSSM